MNRPLRLFLIAGEPSGDKLGAALIKGLQSLTDNTVSVSGVGGPMMQDHGLNSLFPMSDLSVMGLFEVLPKAPKLLARVRQTAHQIIASKPDAIITIDSPDFSMRVLRKVRAALPNIKTIHYVAPSVWAWRPERAGKMAPLVDHVLALLPFEPQYMTKEGMSCDFVGHPAVDDQISSPEVCTMVAQKLGLNDTGPIVTLLPGSRRGEIKRMLSIFKETVTAISNSVPDVQFVLPASQAVVDLLMKQIADWPNPPILFNPSNMPTDLAELEKRAIFQMSEAAFATSGTVALELAAADCPMVVGYKANWATTRMVKKLAMTDTANLINLITGTRIIPEYLFEDCTPQKIAPALVALLTDKHKAQEQLITFADAMQQLGRDQDHKELRAAHSVLRAIG